MAAIFRDEKTGLIKKIGRLGSFNVIITFEDVATRCSFEPRSKLILEWKLEIWVSIFNCARDLNLIIHDVSYFIDRSFFSRLSKVRYFDLKILKTNII